MHPATYQASIRQEPRIDRALRRYQNNSVRINDHIRGTGRPCLDGLAIVEGFKFAPIAPTNTVVYRGLKPETLWRLPGDLEPEMMLTERAFMSTSQLKHVAHQFGKHGVVLELTVAFPIPFIPVWLISQKYREQELLFPPGCRVEITSVTEMPMHQFVQARLLPPVMASLPNDDMPYYLARRQPAYVTDEFVDESAVTYEPPDQQLVCH